jgi:GNAT superfamily N-acetyltransferase
MIVTQATVRAAGLADVNHILAEYREAISNLPPEESANLLWRPYAEFRAAVENGLFFVIENATGNFMAGAGVFDLADAGVKELGMCYVKQEWRGFGLQTLLLHVRVCAATLGQVPDKGAEIGIGTGAARNYAALITGVKPANARSASNTAELGFEPLAAPSPALFNACASCRRPPAANWGRKCCCDFFSLADPPRRQVIEKSLQIENWSKTRNNHQLIVGLKIRHFQDPDFRKALQDIVDELRSDELRSEELRCDELRAEAEPVAVESVGRINDV